MIFPPFLAKVTDQTKIIWICNPNNPSGTIVLRMKLAAFVREVPTHVIIVLDEAYYEYVTDEAYPDGLAAASEQ